MKFKYAQKPIVTGLFETTHVWNGPFKIVRYTSKCSCCNHSKRVIYKSPQSPGKWVCKYCGAKTQTKYIATGHDHTDYSYNTCGCDGARKNGKPYDSLD